MSSILTQFLSNLLPHIMVTVVGVNWLSLSQECGRAKFLARYCSSSKPGSSFPHHGISLLVMPIDNSTDSCCPITGIRVTVVEFLNRIPEPPQGK